MSEEKKGVVETKELVDLVFAIAKVVKKHLADGVQPSDLAKIIVEFATSKEFHEKVMVALKGVQEIPGEIVDLNKPEFLEILVYVWTNLKELIKK